MAIQRGAISSLFRLTATESVSLCAPRRFEKIAVARLLLEILDAPRRPERLQLAFWKFLLRHAFRPLKLKSRAPKSSRHFNPFLSFRAKSGMERLGKPRHRQEDGVERTGSERMKSLDACFPLPEDSAFFQAVLHCPFHTGLYFRP
jgi:hypothetical protein